MTFGELCRLYHIIHIFLSYNLNDLIPQTHLSKPMKLFCKCTFWIPKKNTRESLGLRLRSALERLGPVWIKFGQMLSTRRDILPIQIIDQLAMLQNNVTPFDGKEALKLIESSLNMLISDKFDNFNIVPLATASIAQVHTAILKENGQKVIIKVIRPNISSVIKADLQLLYRLAKWLLYFFPDAKRLKPLEIVSNYESTLLNELNLLHEAANTIQIRRNFETSPILYVPKIYPLYCSENVLVMERIYGIPVSNIRLLKRHGVNLPLLAERGVTIFLNQVFRDSFFHADMHPGNIFISYEHPENPQYIGIDYGIVSTLNKSDKYYLAENFIAFFNRDYHKVAELHIDSGWVPPNTNLIDFEFAIRRVCEPIFQKPLIDISFGNILVQLFHTARCFNMEIQPQLILLQKTLLYVEGLGRQIDPHLDLWKTAKPFLEDWIQSQIGLSSVFHELKKYTPIWAIRLSELPDLLYETLLQNKKIQLQYHKDNLTKNLTISSLNKYPSHYWLTFNQTILLSGTAVLVFRPEWDFFAIILISASFLKWFINY
ncbi:ubiquinone biosynthesis regulatory protein kinase UbiB [Candidatus Erwinia haradaeae]|uniref:Probable protein kinase UbiB n=1 Tax=Candidatus Erwinia haradaeae TaxID=1922217 RepID=A0A451DII3_9GAMM|nr:ubiquinone biosynthesis regulatory protein kinase UbiB [Candidatus Erwinia haradaeae]VFP86474.1 Probable protein kinase UbiB [Candidatus Erwinia haradaeae]